MTSIIDVLKINAKIRPEFVVFTFIDDAGQQSQCTLSQLNAAAQTIAANLSSRVTPGDTVVLLLPQGLDYIKAFFGCLTAGVVAVPLYPPLSKSHSPRVRKVINDCRPGLVLTDEALLTTVESAIGQNNDVDALPPVVSLNALQQPNTLLNPNPIPTADTLAFLQYTSGSTGDPKGVMVSHGNIIANLETLVEATGCHQDDVFCNWLPLFHDLGLVNTLLMPVYLGAHSVLMSPGRFIKRPLRWLEAISAYQASICGAPNFAFEHCCKRIKPQALADLDLSSWRVAFNAAEPIDAVTLSRFGDMFAPTGFSAQAFYPSYGMAEATVFIAGGHTAEQPIVTAFDRQQLQHKKAQVVEATADSQWLVSCGQVQSGHTLAIVDPHNYQALPDGEVGEIWFCGPSVAKGYWQDNDKTTATFLATLAGQPESVYLRTGDLGFVIDGQLYICGRIKDVMIIRGRNYYPQDLERHSGLAFAGLRQGGSVAIEHRGNGLIIQEVERKGSNNNFDYAAAAAAISGALLTEFGIVLATVVFVRTGHLPRTSSGKLQRSQSLQQYLDGDFEILAESDLSMTAADYLPAKGKTEQQLAKIWQQLLDGGLPGRQDHFFALGGQSVTATRLVSDIRRHFAVTLELRQLFENPLLSQMAAAIEQQQSLSMAEADDKITPAANRSEVTLGQQQLWFADQLMQGSSQYHLNAVLQLSGKLDLPALNQALNHLIERHHSLRTVYDKTAGQLTARLKTDWIFKLKVKLKVTDTKQLIEKELTEQAMAPFDLSDDLMLRGQLVKVETKNGPEQHVLSLTFHHIAVDGWSMANLINQLGLFYNAQVQGKTPLPTDLPLQSGDYAWWQNNQLKQGLLAEQKTFWAQRLKGLPITHNLPLDCPRPAEASYQGDSIRQILDPELLAQLHSLSRIHNVTLFMLLNSAFACLLGRLSGEADIVMGTVAANRDRAELDELVGLLVNPLVLRADLSGDPRFDQLLAQSKTHLLDAYDHQHLPFEQVVEVLQPQRSLGAHPLFQVMLILQNTRQAEWALSDLTVTPLAHNLPTAKYDLTLQIHQSDQGLQLDWEYATDLFVADSINNMAQYFELLLRSIVANPQSRLSELALLNQAQQQHLLVELNQTAHVDHNQNSAGQSIYTEQSIHQLFVSQVRRTPQQIALREGEQVFTFDQLNRQANQIAHALMAQGIEPGALVGICIERSVVMVAGLLGILKAGAAYVPLDPDYPSQRLVYMLEDSKLQCLLTRQTLLSRLPLITVPQIDLDDIQSLSAFADSEPDIAVSNPDDLAYVIYTSGSTGQPKGVLGSHGAIINRFSWMWQHYPFIAGEVCCHKTSFNFIDSLWEIFGGLLQGLPTVIVPQQTVLDISAFTALLRRYQVSRLVLVPTLLNSLLADDDFSAAKLPQLNTVICSGETLPAELAGRFSQQLSGSLLLNLYGCSEVAADVSCYPVVSGAAQQNIAIGRPIANMQVYVLGQYGELLPKGQPGQLYVGGKGLAQGYLNQPELTAAQFVVNRFSSDPDSRLFKTGDLVRWVADAHGGPDNLAFLGRADQQLKIRGMRVEPGEAQRVLLSHSAVTDVVVAGAGEPQQLVAWLVAADSVIDKAALNTELRQLLQQLPDHMQPKLFTWLERLVLLPNGKVDYQALPEPNLTAQLQLSHIAPVSQTEQKLCIIWQTLLGLKQVGTNDNFFHIGGHSLAAVKLGFEVQQQFNKTLALKTILAAPTVAQLAVVLDSQQDEHQSQTLITIDPDNRYQPFALTAIQQAYLLGREGDFELGNVGTQGYAEIPFEQPNLSCIEQAWNILVRRHDMLRMVIVAQDSQQVLPKVPDYAMVQTDLRGLGADKAKQKILATREAMAHQVFAVDRWPLFDIRISLIDNEKDADKPKAIVHYCMDMLVVDASSSLLLGDEFSSIYHALCANRPVQLPELSLTFRDVVTSEQTIKQNKNNSQAKDYWLARLPQLPSHPDLPLALNPAQITQPRFERRGFSLAAPLWQQLKSQAVSQQVTPTVLLLGCIARLLSRWSQQPHFCLNLTLFNRPPLHPQISQIVGDFTTLTLLEVDQRDQRSSFAAQLQQLQQQLWNDLEYRDFGGLEVQRALTRQNGQNARFPVVVTSTLGLTQHDDNLAQRRNDVDNGGYSLSQTSQVWLDMQLSEQHGQLHVHWDSIAGLFGKGMLTDMLASFKTLLLSLADNQALWLKPLALALPASQAALVSRVNATEQSLPGGLLHQQLTLNTELQGEKTAVRTASHRLSYRQLGQQSQWLAAALYQGGAKANGLIGVVMHKGWQQVVAVLGILRAGAAYLPIDAALPEQRIKLLLERGEVSQLVTTRECVASLTPLLTFSSTTAPAIVVIEDVQPNEVCPPVQTKPDDLAYVIFTSGSTGEPKGVMISHQSALNTVADINQRYQVGPQDSMLGLSALNFDLSVYDIFGVLAAGGTLVLPERSEQRDPAAWLNYLVNEQVTLWNTVPALMQMLTDYLQHHPVALADLRLVLMSGDWVPTSLPGQIRQLLPAAQIIALGGATEASIWSNYYEVTTEITTKIAGSQSVPYGKALANQQMYVMQQDLSLAPVWLPGDLYIGGAGLADGYWRDHDKTAASFIDHPVSRQRLYRTGDRGRLLPDGNIEFIGRADSQVKIQGYRIETGEIEARLKQHPQVSDALVTSWQNQNSRQLAAYVTRQPTDNQGLDEAQKIAFKLAQKGVRALDGALIELPTGQLNAPLRLVAPNANLHEFGAGVVTLAELSVLLQCFYRKTLDGQTLAKSFYPSGGSLYPVQVYLSVAADQICLADGSWLAAGDYYYQPLNHQLVRMGDQISIDGEAAFSLYLVADLTAIEPIYATAAETLSRLEAGYMAYLLTQASDSGLAIKTMALPDMANLSAPLQLHQHHRLLAAWQGGKMATVANHQSQYCEPDDGYHDKDAELTPDGCQFQLSADVGPMTLSYAGRKSYRNFAPGTPEVEQLGQWLSALHLYCLSQPLTLSYYLYLAEPMLTRDGQGTLAAGGYYYDPLNHRLSGLTAPSKLNLFDGNNLAIETRACFSLFMVGEQSSALSCHQAGLVGQLLCNYGLQAQIGLCAIGAVNHQQVKQTLGLDNSQMVIHSLLGGKVDKAQIQSPQPSTVPPLSHSDILTLHLRQSLPQYMIPRAFMVLDSLPLSANGKVDRKALPTPLPDNHSNEYIAPVTDTQRSLTAIYQQVLGLEKVGTADNFFSAGGDSLLAIKLLGVISQTFGVTLQVAEVYRQPDIKALATAIDSKVISSGQFKALSKVQSSQTTKVTI